MQTFRSQGAKVCIISGCGVDDADLRPLAPEFFGDAPADAVCAAGDDHDLVFKHGDPSFFDPLYRETAPKSTKIFAAR